MEPVYKFLIVISLSIQKFLANRQISFFSMLIKEEKNRLSKFYIFEHKSSIIL